MIDYREALDDIGPDQLQGFFEGWPNPPSPQTHMDVLKSSSYVVLAVDEGVGEVVGFVTAISDGVLCAYIPLLEVLPDYRGRGIGSELLGRMLGKLQDLYMVDLMCDPPVVSFYERWGMQQAQGMIVRNFVHQSGRQPTPPDVGTERKGGQN